MKKSIAIFIVNLLLLSGSLLTATKAYSWGALGHQVVCDIAWRSSSSTTQRQLSAAAKRMGYKTFAHSCTWADKIKSQSRYDALKPLHYMNIARHERYVRHAGCVSRHPPQCVLTAIQYYSEAMNNTSLSQKERDQALLLVGHFVADIHQPLHVSYKDDRGGTRQKVVFQGKPTNLHRLWDSTLLYCQSVNGKRPNWWVLGVEVFGRPMPPVEKVESPVTTWAQESFDITHTIYQEISANKGKGSNKSSVKSSSNSSNKTIVLADDYCERYYPVALERLHFAGSRLAVLLTDLLAKQ